MPGGLQEVPHPCPGRHKSRGLSPGAAVSEPDAKCHRSPGYRGCRFPGGARGRTQRPRHPAAPARSNPTRRRPPAEPRSAAEAPGGAGAAAASAPSRPPEPSRGPPTRRGAAPQPPPRAPQGHAAASPPRASRFLARRRGEPGHRPAAPPGAAARRAGPGPPALSAGQRPGPGAAAGWSGSLPRTPRPLTWMNWMVSADLPTPPPPTTTSRYFSCPGPSLQPAAIGEPSGGDCGSAAAGSGASLPPAFLPPPRPAGAEQPQAPPLLRSAECAAGSAPPCGSAERTEHRPPRSQGAAATNGRRGAELPSSTC